MNTTENIKIIAEFMDFEWYEINKPYIAVRKPNGGVKHFQTDWNDLMEVVKKCLIGEAEHSQDEAKKAISEIYESLCSINISAVYNACIGFIKWYNQQKN